MLKLLKTLNTGLGENALTESHIDEAFEVWWPRLDSQLKSLPAEGVETRQPRSDRDVIEEILGFVRNQNRSSSTVLVTEDDKKHILTARAWKVFRSLYGQIGGSAGGPSLRGTDFVYNLSPTKDGKIIGKYVFVVPAAASPDEMEAAIIANIHETDQRNNQPEPATGANVHQSS